MGKRTGLQQHRREQATRDTRMVAQQQGMEARDSAELVELLHGPGGLESWAAASILVSRGQAAVDALLQGLKHPSRKVRATCALLLDHVADDRCIEPLLHAIRHDPHEAVRRCAMHSLVCDGCKECPLHTDVVAALIEVALHDRSLQVRRRAMFYLSQQPADVRVVPAVHLLFARETDPVLLRRAQHVLQHHRIAVPRESGISR